MSASLHPFQGRITPCVWVFNVILFIFSAVAPAQAAFYDDADNPKSSISDSGSHLTKLNSAGMPTTLEAKHWSCVKDSQTGLMWEKRDPTTALHGHDTFNWYQPERSNPGIPRANPDLDLIDSTCFGFNPNDSASFCNTNAYAERVNLSNYCGYSDWRLPTAKELLTLVDPPRKQENIAPLLDTRFFPFHDPFLYWTSTVSDEDVVVTIFSDEKVFKNSERTDTISIRLVRGASY